MDPVTLLIVCPLVFLAGVVDSIAGGGGLISLTAYLLAGVPAHVALGTNKFSSAIGTAVATARFIKEGFVKWRLALPAAAGALAGSAVGAQLAMLTPDGIFKWIMIGLLPVVAFAVLRKRDLEPERRAVALTPGKQLAIVVVSSLVIGCYDGFYGPGTGTFMMLAFTGAAMLSVQESAGQTKVANLASNVAGLVTFLMHGVAWLELGLVAAVFSIAGNYIGSGLVIKDGSKIVRPIVLVVLALLFVKVAFDLATGA